MTDLPENISLAVREIKSAIVKAQNRVAVNANVEMLSFYFGIGRKWAEDLIWQTPSAKLEMGAANIRQFITEFGKEFSFIGNQYRVEAAGHEHFTIYSGLAIELRHYLESRFGKRSTVPSQLTRFADAIEAATWYDSLTAA